MAARQDVQMQRATKSALAGAALIANAKRPFIRSRGLTIPSFFAGWITTEAAPTLLAIRGARVLRGLRRGDYAGRGGKVDGALEAVVFAGLVSLIVEGQRTPEVFDGAMSPLVDQRFLDERPHGVRAGAAVPVLYGRNRRQLQRNVSYVDRRGRRSKLDVSLPKTPAAPGTLRPALLQVHGGGWILGNKEQQGLALLNHMAAQGWVGFNMNYQLAPKAKFPEQLIDVKRAIAWIREHAEQYQIDPNFIAVTGGSAGGYLTAMAALTANDPEFQPEFESVDTTIQAAVPFYGVYDLLDTDNAMVQGFREFLEQVVVGTKIRDDRDRWERYSPINRVHADAPPMMILHGTPDTLVPVEQARPFVERLAAASDHVVLYVELPGANHGFDIFPSARSVTTVEYVERFLTGVHEGRIK
jgi:acetyl esterase/lipase